jgi:hypothetical protein
LAVVADPPGRNAHGGLAHALRGLYMREALAMTWRVTVSNLEPTEDEVLMLRASLGIEALGRLHDIFACDCCGSVCEPEMQAILKLVDDGYLAEHDRADRARPAARKPTAWPQVQRLLWALAQWVACDGMRQRLAVQVCALGGNP